jgi:CRP-like cAMP-binding protein
MEWSLSNGPTYLTEIGDEDARWLREHGVRRHVRSGERVITEGIMPEHIWVVLEGEFQMSSEELDDPDMLRVKEGELLGEVSYINRNPPATSVTAVRDGILLAVRRGDLDAKISDDPAFGSRMRKVLMDFAVNRMWDYNHHRPAAPAAQAPDPYADLRVHELIEKLLLGDI